MQLVTVFAMLWATLKPTLGEAVASRSGALRDNNGKEIIRT